MPCCPGRVFRCWRAPLRRGDRNGAAPDGQSRAEQVLLSLPRWELWGPHLSEPHQAEKTKSLRRGWSWGGRKRPVQFGGPGRLSCSASHVFDSLSSLHNLHSTRLGCVPSYASCRPLLHVACRKGTACHLCHLLRNGHQLSRKESSADTERLVLCLALEAFATILVQGSGRPTALSSLSLMGYRTRLREKQGDP